MLSVPGQQSLRLVDDTGVTVRAHHHPSQVLAEEVVELMVDLMVDLMMDLMVLKAELVGS
jgi:hypothetical protein